MKTPVTHLTRQAPAEEGMTNMDESKSGRALNSAEKAEADALTNKQWLDTIGGPTGSRR